jgi:hypothetical protein
LSCRPGQLKARAMPAGDILFVHNNFPAQFGFIAER